MNLIDILKQILSTKNELRDILEANLSDFSNSGDISKYPIAIHNIIAKLYNDGYVDGYSQTYIDEFGSPRYIARPEDEEVPYNISSTYYTEYTTDVLTDIMRDVLNYRVTMKESDKLNTESDYFPSYPDYLRARLETVYNLGYEDGIVKAHSDILPSEEVHVPTFSFSDNQFTITTDQTLARLYFSIGENGIPIRYENPVTINETCTVYYWAVVGKSKNEGASSDPYVPLHYTCTYVSTGYRPERELNPPVITTRNKKIYIEPDIDDINIAYSIDDGEWKVYNYPIYITDDLYNKKITAYVYNSEQSSPVVFQYILNDSPSTVYPVRPYIHVDTFYNTTFSCETEGAVIKYYFSYINQQPVDESEFFIYNNETISADASCIVWYFSELNGVKNEEGILFATINKETHLVSKPQNVQFTLLKDESLNCYYLKLYCPSTYAYIYYAYNNPSNYTEVQSNSINIYPDQNTVFTIYAYADNSEELGVNPSDRTEFNYSNVINNTYLPNPIIKRIENKIVIESDYPIYYSIDGQNPYLLYSEELQQRGIDIPHDSYLEVKAQAKQYSSNIRDYITSEIISQTFWYNSNITFDAAYYNEYLTIEGCSGFTLDTNNISDINIYYSYDKENWIGVRMSVSELDTSKKIYLKIDNKPFNTIIFNENDNITISGNILSIYYSDSFTLNAETPTLGDSFNLLFYNNTCVMDCTNLVIPCTTTKARDYFFMFANCTGLTTAPKYLVFNEISDDACEGMFTGCTSLTAGPNFKFTRIGYSGCSDMFSGCTNLTSVGDFELITIGISGCENIFSGCSSLKNINYIITKEAIINNNSCELAFAGCTSLVNPNIQLLAETLSNNCYIRMFYNCSSLRTFGYLPAITLSEECYKEMFCYCNSLIQIENIAATRTATRCMDSMFAHCINLTSSPTLYMPELNGDYCLAGMFYGCSRLNYIRALFLTNPDGKNYTSSWVDGVAEEGLFVQNTDAIWTLRGINGIPINWRCSTNNTLVGTITSITRDNNNKVTILASNNDTIYYQINLTNTDGWVQYTGPFTVDYSCTVYAKCVDSRGNSGNIYSQSLSINTENVVITINTNSFTISNPIGFTYNKLYYKLTEYGTNTIITDWQLFEYDKVYINQNIRIWGMGQTAGGYTGGITWVDYIYQEYPAIPEISDADSNNKVTITCSTSGANIYYRINGAEWIQYDNYITINSDCIIESYSYKNGLYSTANSSKSVTYTTPSADTVATPVITQSGNSVTITCSTSGANILYSFDGTNYNSYTTSIILIESITVYAYATKSGMADSEITNRECQYIGDYTNEYLTFEILEDGVVYWKAYSNTNTKTIQYKKNNEEWTNITSSTNGSTISVNNGDTLKFRTPDRCYTYCDDSYNYNYFNTTCYFNISGNIMSLINNSDFRTRTTFYTWTNGESNFMNFFMDCTQLISAENLILPVTTLLTRCYQYMFGNCINLISAPKSLPATTLSVACYKSMFYGCTKLENIPNILPATDGYEEAYAWMFYGCSNLETVPEIKLTSTGSAINLSGCCESMFEGCVSITASPELIATSLGPGCYRNMFKDCINLISAPPRLPATNIMNWDYCYEGMFEGCTNLINIPRILPATVPAPYCYRNMFKDCISITTAPEIYAEELAGGCFIRMFYGCSSLNYIECHANDNNTITEANLYNWVYGVSSTGTFRKAKTSTWPSGDSGIPSGWTVQNVIYN